MFIVVTVWKKRRGVQRSTCPVPITKLIRVHGATFVLLCATEIFVELKTRFACFLVLFLNVKNIY